ncbi:hypothetical protein DENSPDRAFT_840265 [Dentipellis sp. KUC8613]|nr:hypothetical protein DENSPDRAFT_840265 [Dentipellis sp. KUC8613]
MMQEFMRIAYDCIERVKARNAATTLICERARRGEVSVEEYGRECGYSEEEWKQVGPGIEKDAGVLVANFKRSQVGVLQGRGSRRH